MTTRSAPDSSAKKIDIILPIVLSGKESTSKTKDSDKKHKSMKKERSSPSKSKSSSYKKNLHNAGAYVGKERLKS